MNPTSSFSQSAQPNWSELLSKASQGSSLFIKGEGKQVSYIAISMLDSAPDKSIEEGYKKLSIQQIVEISKSCLNQDSTQIDENIRIKSQVTALLEIESTKLKETIEVINDAEAKKTIEGLDHSKKLFGLNQDETDFLQALNKYGAKDQKGLIEIAKKAAAQDGWGVSESIQSYGIQDQEVLIEIAKIAAAQDGGGVSEFIQRYGIEDLKGLIEIAKIAAVQDGWRVSKQIQKYGIKEEKGLIEIAKIAAAQDESRVSEYIQNYGIKEKQALIEIAKIAAAQSGFRVSQFIQSYGIKDKQALIQIAKIAAAQNGQGVSQFIQNYGIKEEKGLIEIAEKAAAQSGLGLSAYIQNYGIKEEKGLIEIAKIAAAQDGRGVSQFIQNYGIKDKQVLIEIAKIAAAQSLLGVSEYIQNYGIEEEKALIEIAKIAAAQNGVGVSAYIQNYGIEDKQVLTEIAKIAAAQSGQGVSQFIQNYGIEDKQALIEIAKIAASQSGGGVSLYIQNYEIKEEKALIEIAKKAAAQDGRGVSLYIERYGLKDKEVLIEIAKIAAAQSGSRVSQFIQNYGIQEQKGLIEIAKIAAAQSGEGVSEYIQNYGIKEEKALFSIFLNAMSSSPDGALKFFSNYKLTLDFFIPHIESFCKEKEWILPKEIVDTILYKGEVKVEKKSPEIQKIMLTYLTCFLGAAALENLNPEEFSFLIENGFLKAALNYTNPNMRYKFINPMIELTKNDKAKAYALKLLNRKSATISKESVKSKKPEKSVNPPHARIPMMLLALLETQGVPENICDAQYEIARMNLFKPGKENKVYVNALYSIFLSKELDSDDKANLIKKIDSKETPVTKGDKANLITKIDSKETLVTLRAISTIKDLNKMADLKKDNLKKKTISTILEEKIQELIPTKTLADFAEKFTKTFGESRVPNYIITYAAKLQTENQSLQCLGVCLDGLLAGDFLKNRYDTLKSKHLTEVFREKPELLIEWKGGKNASLSSFLTEADVSLQPINFSVIFKDNLIEHLKYKDAPILFDFLKSGKEVIQENLENDELENMQINCIKLMDKSLSAEDQKKLLKEIDSDLKETNRPEFEQFKTDIKDLLSGLIKREEVKKSYSGYSIVDTDDYQDLFLSGTEVEGSCQNVDGTPSLNKCLIAYVFDGKNRLLAVKDKDGKIIARQIFRILLNGKEPVLFLERVYPSLVDLKLKLAIEEFGKERAKALGLPLLTIDPTKPKYEGSISSLSTLDPIPFEYSDAGDGHVTNGTFTISSPNCL